MAQRASQQFEFITQIQDQIQFDHPFLFLQMVPFIQVVDTNKSSKADYTDYFQILFVRSSKYDDFLLFVSLATIPGAMAGGSFSPGDYAWGQNGLDDIITQVKKGSKVLAFVQ